MLKPVSVPQIRISDRAALRLREGHVWVYASDVEDEGGAAAGDLVHVLGYIQEGLGEGGRPRKPNTALTAAPPHGSD